MKRTKKILLITAFGAALTSGLLSCASTQKEETIQDLIIQGRYEEAKGIFQSKTDINAVDEDGNTALHIAAQVNEADLVSFLIIRGASTEIKNNMGNTPLHVAIKNDNIESARVLAIVHGDIFAKDAEENTALELALIRGSAWYDAMITPQTGEIRDVDGQTIVHYFVKTLNDQAIDCCIRQQIPLSVKDNNGLTPLHLAFQNAADPLAIQIAAKLITAGADTIGGDYAYFEDAVRTHNVILRFNDGQTPLHIATVSGHTGVADYLLKNHKPVRVQDLLQAQDISGATPLHEAVRYGQTDIARLLLQAGAQVDALDSIGKTPFLLIIPEAAQYTMYDTLLAYKANIAQKDMFGDTVLHIATLGKAKTDVLKLLIDKGAPINERNKQGVTPLALAIDQGMEEHVVFYANAGADINAEDQDGNTPLTRALGSESIHMLQTLITKQNISSKDSAGNTPLHIAIMSNSPVDYIKYLIDTGADVNARNKSGDSVLYLAVQKNMRQVGDMLLEKNADIFATNTENYSPLRLALEQGGEVQNWLITSQTLNTTDGSGNTPLHYAAEWKLNNAMLGLIEKGAKVNSINANGESALFSAVKADSASTIHILVENGAVTDSRDNLARDHLGNTPLHAAVRWNALNAAVTLIQLGVDVNAQNMSGKTALSDCCRSGKTEMANLLIINGADVNAADATGRTVLMDTVAGHNEGMLSLLLQSGANPLIQEMSGRNAYHEAALSGNINIIRMIRNAGGNPLSRDSYGETPFSLVLRTNDEKQIKEVLGGNLNIVDSDGNTPVHIAVERKVPAKMLTMLLNMRYPVNQRNGKGVTPLYMAVAENLKTHANLLLERGANPYIATITNDTALSLALKSGNTTLLESIARHAATKTDMQGDGILHYAARIANADTVRYLVGLGLDKKAKNISGETPAEMAERWQRLDIAELLK